MGACPLLPARFRAAVSDGKAMALGTKRPPRSSLARRHLTVGKSYASVRRYGSPWKNLRPLSKTGLLLSVSHQCVDYVVVEQVKALQAGEVVGGHDWGIGDFGAGHPRGEC